MDGLHRELPAVESEGDADTRNRFAKTAMKSYQAWLEAVNTKLAELVKEQGRLAPERLAA